MSVTVQTSDGEELFDEAVGYNVGELGMLYIFGPTKNSYGCATIAIFNVGVWRSAMGGLSAATEQRSRQDQMLNRVLG